MPNHSPDDPEFQRLLQEFDQTGVFTGGPMPRSDEPYVPTAEEVVEGMMLATEGVARLAQARGQAYKEVAERVFQPEEPER
jgi:hypothetical protein